MLKNCKHFRSDSIWAIYSLSTMRPAASFQEPTAGNKGEKKG